MNSRNYRLYLEECKLDKIFHTLVIAKIFQELFTPTLNRIAVSVQYASSTPVVIQAGLNYQLQPTNKTTRDENFSDSEAFFEANINMTFQVLTVHTLTLLYYSLLQYIIYVTTRAAKSTHQQANPQKTQQVEGFTYARITCNVSQLPPTEMVSLRPPKRCLFKFLCKSFRSCKVYNS